jgi:hypothetical protein
MIWWSSGNGEISAIAPGRRQKTAGHRIDVDDDGHGPE